MSCSKPATNLRMHSPREPPLKHLETMRSYLGEPYVRTTQAFSLTPTEDKRNTRYFTMHYWETKHKKGDVRVCAASVFEAVELDTDPCVLAGMPHVQLDDGQEYRELTGTQLGSTLLAWTKKRHLVHGFTTNDIAAFDSFSRGQDYQRCVEHSVMCVAKTKIHTAWVQESDPDELVAIALTSKFVQPHTLRAIVDGQGNDSRFDKGLPPAWDTLSKEEQALHKSGALEAVRMRIEAMDSMEFKDRYLAWLRLNLTLDPVATSPEVFKVEVGRALLMSRHEVRQWDQLGGLLFLLATSKHLTKEPVNLRIALCCKDATILEVTPDDARYGVKPPDGQRLDIVKTPQGKAWLLGLDKTHGEPQRHFVNLLDTYLQEMRKFGEGGSTAEFEATKLAAVDLLTRSMDAYKHGILGLTKAICLRHFVQPGWFHERLNERISEELSELGLTPRWNMHGVDVFEDPKTIDAFAMLARVGLEAPRVPA